MPDWVSFQPDVGRWNTWLTERGFDESSRGCLYLLAQRSQSGYDDAIGILTQIWNKLSDNPNSFSKPSAWLNSSVHKSPHWQVGLKESLGRRR